MLQFRYPSTVKPVRVALVEPVAYQGAVMVFPGFAGRIQGRDAFIAGFRDFCENGISATSSATNCVMDRVEARFKARWVIRPNQRSAGKSGVFWR